MFNGDNTTRTRPNPTINENAVVKLYLLSLKSKDEFIQFHKEGGINDKESDYRAMNTIRHMKSYRNKLHKFITTTENLSLIHI